MDAKSQMEAQIRMRDMQLDEAKARQQMQLKQQKTELDMALKSRKTQQGMALSDAKTASDIFRKNRTASATTTENGEEGNLA